ncbi:MAG: type II toxin-antitoxin system VapC family toxin [Desulfohalobiaceae bacterium]|nr:type II toxin-antitoxin system VapC family toxin [Desulfohalobiaceae bacterium]
MRFIDTNVFLRYLTGDDKEKAANALALLKRLEMNREKATTNLLVIFETIFTLEKFYKVDREKVRNFLQPILELRGLKFRGADTVIDALDIHTSKNIPFADAFNAAYMRANDLKEIYSYDEDFDRIEDIDRIEPPFSSSE